VNTAASQGRRSGRLATLVVLGLLWPALGLSQPWPAHPKPAPALKSGEPGRPYRPRYGRWSPGQVLPPTAGAVVIADYQQFHLRRPPRGYTWMLCDGDYILANAAGLIFEVIPSGGG
jgi:Ni/Co efflux regulator RcnB